jgi:hypothetical protein
MNPARVLRSAIVLKASTLLHLQHVLANRKYRVQNRALFQSASSLTQGDRLVSEFCQAFWENPTRS